MGVEVQRHGHAGVAETFAYNHPVDLRLLNCLLPFNIEFRRKARNANIICNVPMLTGGKP